MDLQRLNIPLIDMQNASQFISFPAILNYLIESKITSFSIYHFQLFELYDKEYVKDSISQLTDCVQREKYMKIYRFLNNDDPSRFAADRGELDIFVYMHYKKMKISEKASSIAAQYGRMPILKFLQENGYKLSEETCETASNGGHLDCLKFAHQNGCPLTEKALFVAMYNSHFHCAEYLLENGCPYPEIITTSMSSSLERLKFLHKHGVKWDRNTTKFTCGENPECLKYAHEHGCPWDVETIIFALYSGNLESLKYAHENGCPTDIDESKLRHIKLCNAFYPNRNEFQKCVDYARQNFNWKEEVYRLIA